MSKVQEIMDAVSSIISDDRSESKLEVFVAAASSDEDTIAASFNTSAPELAILLYNLSNRNDDIRTAIQAVSAQISEDNARAYANIIRVSNDKIQS